MNHDTLTPLGRRIRVGMAANGIASPSDLARRVGVSHQTVRRWLYDEAARIEAGTALDLADVLHLSMRWIVLGHGEPTPRSPLQPDEAALLAEYRHMSSAQRSILRHAAHDLIEITA